MSLLRLPAFLLFVLLLAGCGGRAVLGLDAHDVLQASAAVPAPVINDKTGPKAVIPIFVATSRARSNNLALPYSSERSPTLNFARVDVGIPPNHKNGEVEKASVKPDPARNFVATSFQPYPSGQVFIDRINAELARRPEDKREIFIFVHGYNNNFADGVFREAQIAYDYSLPAVAVHYSWPSAATLGLYVYDRDSATYGREGLAELLQLITRTNATRILLVGHSMGSFVVMEALTKLAETGHKDVFRRLSGVMLAAPDIDVDVFQAQVADIGQLPRPFVVLASRADRALGVSKRIVGGHARVGDGSSIPMLQNLGILVLDASQLDGGSHGVFASSPTLMAMARSGELTRHILEGDETGTGQAILADETSAIAGAASLVFYLPARILGAGR